LKQKERNITGKVEWKMEMADLEKGCGIDLEGLR
jgi:hypothetical protein